MGGGEVSFGSCLWGKVLVGWLVGGGGGGGGVCVLYSAGWLKSTSPEAMVCESISFEWWSEA